MDVSTAQCIALLAYSLKPFGHSLNFAKRPRLEPLRSQGMPLLVFKWSFMCFVSAHALDQCQLIKLWRNCQYRQEWEQNQLVTE